MNGPLHADVAVDLPARLLGDVQSELLSRAAAGPTDQDRVKVARLLRL